MGSLFKKGYKAAGQRSEENKKKGAGSGKWLSLKDGDSVNVAFLDPEPITLDVHVFFNGGKVDEFLCINEVDECGFCEKNHNPRLIGIFVVYNFKAKKVQYFKRGITEINAIGNLHKKGRLENRKYEVSRTGSGAKDTAYNFFPGDAVKVPASIRTEGEKALAEIKKLFPQPSAKQSAKDAEKMLGDDPQDD